MFKNTFAALILVAFGIGSVALLQAQDQPAPTNGRSYLVTVTDALGNFASREVITLHTDQTISVIDSGQGGPAFLFSSELGVWKPNGTGGIVAKTLDFDFPSAGIARLNYTINFAQNHTQVTGTITLTDFPLEANPLDGGGTVVGTFSFTGTLITL
jgi:hypothetical protein